jgi:hypothetical protein
VIAHHYAEPVERSVAAGTPLRAAPSTNEEPLRLLAAGETFLLLDDRLGWAWGYAGEERRVGYVESDSLS